MNEFRRDYQHQVRIRQMTCLVTLAVFGLSAVGMAFLLVNVAAFVARMIP